MLFIFKSAYSYVLLPQWVLICVGCSEVHVESKCRCTLAKCCLLTTCYDYSLQIKLTCLSLLTCHSVPSVQLLVIGTHQPFVWT